MPWFGMRYAVVWYALCRTGMFYAVLAGMCNAVVWYALCRAGRFYAVSAGMCYAVVLWITFADRLPASHFARRA